MGKLNKTVITLLLAAAFVIICEKSGRVSAAEAKPENEYLTRAVAAEIISNAVFSGDVTRKTTFTDVTESSPYYPYINNVVSISVMTADSEGRFMPDKLVTREAAAAVLYRAFKNNLDDKLEHSFNDKNDVSEWAAQAVGVLAGNGITAGYPDGSFQPLAYITKPDFNNMLKRITTYSRSPSPEPQTTVTYTPTPLPVNTVTYTPTPFPADDQHKHMIALTFDDGPSANTLRLLKILNANGAKGTFCVVGNKVTKYQREARRIVEQGSEIIGHSWDHKDFTKLTDEQIRKELSQTQDAIYAAVNIRPKLYRAPYGAVNDRVKSISKEMGLSIVLWSVDTRDWESLNADAVYNEVMKDVKDGAIILEHETHPTTIDAMERVVPELVRRGYKLVTVSELLRAAGKDTAPGSVIYIQ